MSSEWPILPLDQCLDALIDYRGKTPEKTESGVPLVTAKVIKGGRIEKPTEFIAMEAYESWMRRGIPMAGDVVLTTEAPLGEVAQLGQERVALAQRVVTLRGKAGILENAYLRYLLQTDEMQSQLAARATGTTVLGIKQSELRKVLVQLPPIELQRSAASLLASLDDRITLLRETNATLEAIAQALFKSWFVDFDPVRAKAEGRQPDNMDPATAGLFPDSFDDSKQGQIPKSWSAATLDTVSRLNELSWSPRNAPETIRYIDLASVKANAFEQAEELCYREAPSRARRVLRAGDTLVGTVRPGNRSFGFVADPEIGLTGSTGFAVLSPRTETVAPFIYLCATREENISRLTSLADGGAYPAVKPQVVAATPCVLPDDKVMVLFAEGVGPLLVQIDRNARQARLLAELRDIVLPRLISGRLRLLGSVVSAATVFPIHTTPIRHFSGPPP